MDPSSNPFAPGATVQEARDKPARRWLALLLMVPGGAPLSGIGLFLIGRKRAAVIWSALGLASVLLVTLGMFTASPWLSLPAMGAVVVVWVAAFIHTASARKGSPPAALPAWLLAGAAVLLAFGVQRGMKAGRNRLEAFQIPSAAMAPTLLPGDHIFVDKRDARQIQRGDVVVFRYPPNPSIDYIKRVIAIDGDAVEMRDGQLMVNGAPLEQAPADLQRPPEVSDREKLVDERNQNRSYAVVASRQMRDFAKVDIGPNQIFVMGDYRDNSHDSRYWGTVPVELVKGRVLTIWWSRDPESGTARWHRMGSEVR